MTSETSFVQLSLNLSFYIKSQNLNLENVREGIKMEIVFKRRLTNELLTTYLPTFLLLGITYSTTFFKSFFFEAALTVNLTVMLVITTLFIRQGYFHALNLNMLRSRYP